MKYLMKFSALAVAIAVAMGASQVQAQTVVASEDFDGGAVNLTTGFDASSNLDGGGGDWFGIASINGWPQVDDMGMPLGVPFSLIDESGTGFPPDSEGILSDLNSDRDNVFFSLSDTREWTDDVNGDPTNPLVASWVFDISSATSALQLSIDMGQCSDGGSFGGINEGLAHFEYSIDGGPFQTAFLCEPFDATATSFVYRSMDVFTEDPDTGENNDPITGNVFQATGPGTITKFSAVDGSAEADTILNKCPADGEANAGSIDTFLTDIVGSGSSIEIRLTTHMAFEAMVFDNIVITEVGGSTGGVVTPTEFTVTRGEFVSGGTTELAESDNIDLSIRRSNSDIQSRTEFTAKAISPVANPTTFEVTLEGSVFARSTVNQTIEAFNYLSNSWEALDTRTAQRLTDTTVTVSAPGSPFRFVEGGTNCIQVRIRYQSLNPRQNFASNTDQIFWTID